MIAIEGLQKIDGGNLIVELPLLTIEPGQIVALVGPVGSGKAALLDLLLGRSRPTSGTIRLGHLDPVSDRDRIWAQVGVLFAEDSLYPRQTALGNLRFQCRLRGLPAARASQVLMEVGLGDCARQRASALPSGLARRLAFGCAIVHQPQVLLLVEPFARSDEATITLLCEQMRLQAEIGVSLLVLARDTSHLLSVCDTIHVLAQGRIVDSVEPRAEVQPQMPFKIPVKLEARVALVNPGDILYAMAHKGRAVLVTAQERLPTQYTLRELEERLARSGFFRAHRAYLVNLQHVREVIPYTRNSFSLILDDTAETEIPLSKSSAGELRDLLDY